MNDNAGFQSVDTNVLVYAHDRHNFAKQQKAQVLLKQLWQSGLGCVSLQVLQEFYVTVTRKIREPLAPESAVLVIKSLKLWQIHQPNVEDILNAIALQERYDVSFWDALILRSATQLDCQIIWSEDLNAGQHYGTVQVQNPFTNSESLPSWS